MITDDTFNTNPIGALYTAFRDRRSRLATLLGSAVAIVPIGGYYLGHSQLTSWDPTTDPSALLAYAALSFSASTVYSWGRAMFGGAAKAVAFAALVEGLMMWGQSDVLGFAALVLIVFVNVMTCGCKLAIRAAEHAPTIEPTLIVEPTTEPAMSTRIQPLRYTTRAVKTSGTRASLAVS